MDNSKILQKWKQLDTAENAFSQLENLHLQREQIEEKINAIKNELEQLQFKEKTFNTEPMRIQLQSLLKEKYRIDKILDEWEELTEGGLLVMREELLLLCEDQPEQYLEVQALWSQWKQLAIVEKEISAVSPKMDELQGILELILRTRKSLTGRGWLQYIFSVSPNAIIERGLHETHALSGKMVPLLQHAIKMTHNHSVHLLFREIKEVVEDFQPQCKKIWGFRHIDLIVAQAEQEIRKLNEALRNEGTLTKSRMVGLKAVIDKELEGVMQTKGP